MEYNKANYNMVMLIIIDWAHEGNECREIIDGGYNIAFSCNDVLMPTFP